MSKEEKIEMAANEMNAVFAKLVELREQAAKNAIVQHELSYKEQDRNGWSEQAIIYSENARHFEGAAIAYKNALEYVENVSNMLDKIIVEW